MFSALAASILAAIFSALVITELSVSPSPEKVRIQMIWARVIAED